MSRLKHKLLNSARGAMIFGLTILAFLAAGLGLAQPAYAAFQDRCPDGFVVTVPNGGSFNQACANHQTGTKTNDQQSPNPNVSTSCSKVSDSCACINTHLTTGNCGIIFYLWVIINVLSALAGIVLVVSLIAAGIQWSTAGDNPQQLSAAKTRIFNVIIALFLFVFTYAFLQWVVPGGIF